ncbi:MAG: hypothetical protein Kow0042_24780 [Calditrichia bacterium]
MQILLVDDEKTIRKGLGFALRKKGYQVDEIETAYQALQKKYLAKFDLIILDLNLPYISGSEFIKILMKKKIDVPVLIMTSQSEGSADSPDVQFIPGQIISKDLTMTEILESIEQFIKIQLTK